MVTFKETLANDMKNVFTNTDEFGETCSYLSPAGVTTTGVKCVINRQSFVTELSNEAGLGATIVASRELVDVAIQGKLTATSGEVFVVYQILSIDNDSIIVTAMADMRFSPGGFRG